MRQSMRSFLSQGGPETSPRRMGRYALYIGGALLLLYVAVQAPSLFPAFPAEEPDKESQNVAVSSASSSDSGIEVVTWGNVAAVLLLVGGAGYALYLQKNGSTTTSNAMLRPMGKIAMGQSQQLRLVGCADEVHLLGVTEEEVALLKTYPAEAFEDDSAVAAANGDVPSSTGTSPTAASLQAEFSDVLARFVRRDAST